MPARLSGSQAAGSGARQNVTVCVRPRPCEGQRLWTLDKANNAITPTDQHPSLARRGTSSADDDYVPGTYDFAYDNLVLPSESTEALYSTSVLPVVRAAMDGFNGTVFAYGQTGSGKTYTMTGTPDEPGVIPCAVADVFAMIREDPTREFLLRVSYLEIYNETLRDLLAEPESPSSAPSTPRSGSSSASRARGPRIVEERGRVMLTNLHEEIVTTPGAVLAALERGENARHIGATDWNVRSSRSHCVFQITIESRDAAGEARVSRLNLIDLAGSERAASEAVRRKEGAFINKSLLTLGTVIAKLTEPGNEHIPYRDSKLTRLLQPSLSGDARVAVVCTLSLSEEHALESLSTLKFGRRCKLVVTTARRHTSVDEKGLLERYRRELDVLRARLDSSDRAEGHTSPQTPTTPLSSEDLGALSQQRAAAEQEVAEMHETRQNLKNQIDHLTRLILTSRSVAVDTPQRKLAHELPHNVPGSPAARRGPRMSDVPSRALHPSARSEMPESDTVLALRRELAEAHERHKREEKAHAERVHEIEAQLSARQAELVKLREEYANEEAHREFKELVATNTGSSPYSDSVNDVALHARIAALERALAEERAMRDLARLPERPAASPMQARPGLAPLAPPRARSRSASPAPDEMQRLQSRIDAQESLIQRLQDSVESWRERMRGQSRRVRELLALYEEPSAKQENPVAARAAAMNAAAPPPAPVPASRPLPSPQQARALPSKSPASVPLPPSPVRSARSPLPQPPSALSSRPPQERGPRAQKRTFVPAEPAQPAPAPAPAPAPRRLPKEMLLAPFGAPPTAAQSSPPPPYSGPRVPSGDKTRSLAAAFQRRVSDRRGAAPVRTRSPQLDGPSISARTHALESAASSGVPAREAEASAPARLPASATVAFRMPTVPPPPPATQQRDTSGVSMLKMPPSQSQVLDRRARDSILRELNDLKAMPRVESSRTMYLPRKEPPRPALMPATGYRTDASAYYV